MKNLILICCLLIVVENEVIGQSANQNFNKYWYYRDRLKKRFLIEGNQQRQSIVAHYIEYNQANNIFDYKLEE
ncbi:MAG: hypothetical protein RL065_1825 [Bacteroidota bacterium]